MLEGLKNFLKSKHLFWIGLFLVIGYTIPYFIFGQNSYLNPIDNLDSNVVWYKVIADQGAQFWSNDRRVEGMIGLQPRHVYPSEFDPILWFYTLFSPYWAYTINFFLIHIIAFFSMYVLLKSYILKGHDLPDLQMALYAVGGSVIFAIIPFWPHAGLSAAGIPLVVIGVLEVDQKNYKKGAGLLLLYTIYSSLILAGIFVLITYAIGLMLWLIRQKRSLFHYTKHLVVMVGMSIIYLLANYRLVYAMVFTDFKSHRINSVGEHIVNLQLTEFLDFPFRSFVIDGQWHAGALFPLISLLALGFVFSGFWMIKKRSNVFFIWKMSLVVLLLLFLFSNGVSTKVLSAIPILGSIQWNRFYFLIPFLMTFSFVFFYQKFFGRMKAASHIFVLLTMGSMGFYITKDYNWNNQLKKVMGMNPHGQTFLEYYHIPTFEKVKAQLEEENYTRVVSLGLDPAIAIYHGARSADGYLANYRLSSKEYMREVIHGELEKAPILKNYFDNWGSRCYFFNSNFNKDLSTDLDSIFTFEYDLSSMKRMGITHVLSSLPFSDKISVDFSSDIHLMMVN